MIKLTSLAILLLTVVTHDSLARPAASRKLSRRARSPSGYIGSGERSSDSHSYGSCEVTYNSDVISTSPCDDDEVCSDESSLTLTQGEDTVTYKFCNMSQEIEPKLACRIENATGAVLHERPCLVGECNSNPFTYNSTDDDSGSNSSREHFPEELLTLFFCERKPTDVDYSPLVYNRACRIRNNTGDILRNGTCPPTPEDPSPACPEDKQPVTFAVQGEDLQLDFCDPEFNITDFFGGRRGNNSKETYESSEGSDERDGKSSEESSESKSESSGESRESKSKSSEESSESKSKSSEESNERKGKSSRSSSEEEGKNKKRRSGKGGNKKRRGGQSRGGNDSK